MPTERKGSLQEASGTWTVTNPQPQCQHEDHFPDKRSLEPGRYRHECPACGYVVYFDVYPEGAWL